MINIPFCIIHYSESMGKVKKGRNRKKTSILFVLLLIFGVIIAVGVYQNMHQSSSQSNQEYSAAEYFEIVNATINDGKLRRNETTGEIIAVEIYSISFEVKAVKGDAHNVVVQGWARSQPEELGTILKGEARAVIEQRTSTSAPYLSQKNADGKFPMTIRITSQEASGFIIIYF